MAPPPTLCPFDIPHIFDAIFENLPFADLHRCIFVDRSWHYALIPRLWQDVITFRPDTVDHKTGLPYRNCFDTFESVAALHKHARYIRVLTCRGYATLTLLIIAGISDLVELNFIVNENPEVPPGVFSLRPSEIQAYRQQMRIHATPYLDLGGLLKVIGANPALRTLSVVNVRLYDRIECKALVEFVAALDEFPRITCLYLGGRFANRNENNDPSLAEVFKRRLDLTNAGEIKKLDFNRSGLGLASLAPVTNARSWPGRSSGWKTYLPSPHYDSLAVVEHDGTLLVRVPQVMESRGATLSILRRFPQLRHLNLGYHDSLTFQELPWRCRNLQEIDFKLDWVPGEALERFLGDPRVQLSSVKLDEIENEHYAALRPFLLQTAPHFLRDALVKVTLTSKSVPMSSVFEILAICSHLEALSVPNAVVSGSEPEAPRVWASQCLQVLHLGLFLKGGQLNLGTRNNPHDLPASNAAAQRIAPVLMQQIGKQEDLRDLHLLLNDYHFYNRSVFLELALGPANGLGQLAGLSRLEKFAITGLLHRVGATEIAWMKQHWPRLRMIMLPVLEPGQSVHARSSRCKALLPDYTPWYPQLEVKF
ncbi:hypothetical protein BGZ82_011800 [Podila clonocystis]|nr:hypothetical protein BGZ82_011800 [Podila clonocystis]